MELKQIAYIKTSFPDKFGVPRQSGLVKGLRGKIIFLPEFRTPDALRGIEGYSHLWLIWGFSESHKSEWSATVAPPRLGGKKRMGVFATRSPYRPNPIGLSSVELESVEVDEKLGTVLNVRGIDMIDNTPIYDIKPYLAYADSHPDARGGFANEVLEHHLKVEIPENVEKLIDENERDNIIGLLSEDPRSAYIHDEERVWGIYYGGKNIRFRVVGDVLTVTDIEDM